MHKMDFQIEACVESLQEAINAERLGATRIELCTDLANDGLTPNKELIIEVVKNLKIPVKVMIRPRKGDFLYSSQELKQMEDDVLWCKNNGIWGIVFGFAFADSSLDIELTKHFVHLARPMNVTVHRVIDKAPDIVNEVRKLQEIGVDSILSSGGKETALEGLSILKQMLLNAGNTEIIAAGKVTDNNLSNLHNSLCTNAYHGRKIVGDL